MSHELDITDGVASFADSRVRADGRVDAWHRLGQGVGHLMTAQEVLREAKLADWNVRKLPIYAQEPPILGEDGVTTPDPIAADDRFMTVRTNPVNGRTDYLGVVGNVWTPIQNEETADLLNAIVDEGGAHFETAGALDHGRRTFVTMKLPQAISLGGTDGTPDNIDIYLAALNSHDGMAALNAIITPVRIRCKNTETAALRQAKASFSIRHTLSAPTAILEARSALGLTFKYMEEFEREAQALVEHEMTDAQFREFAEELMGVNAAETDRQRDNRRTHANSLQMLWATSSTLSNIRGSRWAAYNAVSEYTDHLMPARATAGRSEAEQRAQRVVTTGSTAQLLKNNAWRALTN